MIEKQPSSRFCLIDAIRAIAIINMVAYHLCYDIFCNFGVWPNFYRAVPFIIWERFICCTFIIVSGISVNFSHHGYRRGILINLCGFLITIITVLFMPDQAIWFGVLNLHGCAMLITFALRRELSRIKPLIGALIFFVLFMLLYGVPNGFIGLFNLPLIHLPDALYQYRFLAFLGFPSWDFSSSDYFPLIPWTFLYLFGFELWRLIAEKGYDRCFRKKIPVLDFIGRHSLSIYLIHQPLLYGVCWLIFSFIA